MRRVFQARGWPSLGFLVLLLGAAPPAGVVASRTADRDAVPLSGFVAVTLVLEGPAPLQLTPPKGWLADESEAAWGVKAGAVSVEARPGGRERWTLPLRLDPFPPVGEAVVHFATVEVRAGGDTEPRAVTWDDLGVRVTTSLKDVKADDARPVTGVEDPPAPPPADAAVPLGQLLALGLVLLAGAALVVARYRKRPAAVSPAAWAAGELDRLDAALAAGGVSPAAGLDQLSGVLRAYLERRGPVPATRRTTVELFAEAGTAGGWRAVLERCDAAKFAREAATADECRRLVAVGRRLVSGEPA